MNVKQAAEAWQFNIPSEELDRIAPVVEDVTAAIEKALDRDLSTMDPLPHFRPTHR
jgi:hypothetical protein